MYGLGINPDSISRRVRACDYLVVAQLFLQDNFLLKRELKPADIKPRLLGHWGTCHGINLAYANLKAHYRNDPNFSFVLGPGHGFPALQANLFIDGDLAKVDEKATRNLEGIKYICKNFSWPGGFPSHASPVTPGVICEGGELGYSLATAYGAALGHPEKTVAVLIGDGEFETATALASLNLCKLLATETNGRVIPILHLNGYKISAPTIAARKSERELMEMLRGFGYSPIVIDGEDMEQFQDALDQCDAKSLYAAHRADSVNQPNSGRDSHQSTYAPFIIMKSQKGAGGPAYVGDQKVAGNYYAHQIPLKNPKTDETQLHQLENWLKSYRFDELFNEKDGFLLQPMSQARSYSPSQIKTSYSSQTNSTTLPATSYLTFPADLMGPETIDNPGTERYSSAKKLGQLLEYTMRHDPDFYLFSPDETTSNKLDAAYNATARAWAIAKKPWDMPESASGRIVELLSENVLFSLLTGHVLGSSSQGMMTSYESFFEITASQIIQYLKFLKQASETSWRKMATTNPATSTNQTNRSATNIPGLNLLSTSTCWRQDHNGFSHQSPALISTLLSYPDRHANCFFPVDDVSSAAIYNYMYHSKNVVNLTTFNKTDEPRWIDKNHAEFQLKHGASIFGFASDDNPDYVFTAAGDIMTRETLAAIDILKQDLPGRRFRFVGISVLSYGAIGTTENPMPQDIFNDYFTLDKPIIANFHGYPDDLRSIFTNYTNPARIITHGFIEKGSTTTPFEMLSLNHASRYHLCLDIVRHENNQELINKYENILKHNTAYAKEHGEDQIVI